MGGHVTGHSNTNLHLAMSLIEADWGDVQTMEVMISRHGIVHNAETSL